jgi:mono/diheme cytochrome c family protein
LKRFWKFLVVTLAIILVLPVAAITFTIGWRPFIGPKVRPLTSRKFEPTPQRLERGRYLFTYLAGCAGCHSPHDWKTRGAPIPPGMEGAGEVMPLDDSPGRVVAPNLTSDRETGTGTWTDDQLARAIREGIGYDGRALFPMMPYMNFEQMSDEDLASVVVFVRSLSPVRNALPKTELVFPIKYLIRGAPEPVISPVAAPDLRDPVRRGAYLVNLADCQFCHTQAVRGQPIKGMELAGGQIFTGPFGKVASANITPDATGISYYDEVLFFQALRTGYVKARELNPLMPYSEYKGLSDEDLKAIFTYLHTLKPVKHYVDNSEAPTYCKVCRGTHGGGDRN